MIELIPLFFNGKINSIVEIGSADGDDADFLAKKYNVDSKNVHIFEPRKDACLNISEKYPQYNINNIAISNFEKNDVLFYIDNYNGEISSLREREDNIDQTPLYDSTILVKVTSMDNFILKNKIISFDMVKIDVEGCTYEVLSGFIKNLSKVKVLHIECENVPFWKGQKLKTDVINLLNSNFVLIYSTELVQDDLILVNRENLNDVCFSCIEDYRNNLIQKNLPIRVDRIDTPEQNTP